MMRASMFPGAGLVRDELFQRKERRYKILTISQELLLQALFSPLELEVGPLEDHRLELRGIILKGLPEQVEFVGAPSWRADRQCIEFLLYSPEFAEVAEGAHLEQIELEITAHCIPIICTDPDGEVGVLTRGIRAFNNTNNDLAITFTEVDDDRMLEIVVNPAPDYSIPDETWDEKEHVAGPDFFFLGLPGYYEQEKFDYATPDSPYKQSSPRSH